MRGTLPRPAARNRGLGRSRGSTCRHLRQQHLGLAFRCSQGRLQGRRIALRADILAGRQVNRRQHTDGGHRTRRIDQGNVLACHPRRATQRHRDGDDRFVDLREALQAHGVHGGFGAAFEPQSDQRRRDPRIAGHDLCVHAFGGQRFIGTQADREQQLQRLAQCRARLRGAHAQRLYCAWQCRQQSHNAKQHGVVAKVTRAVVQIA